MKMRGILASMLSLSLVLGPAGAAFASESSSGSAATTPAKAITLQKTSAKVSLTKVKNGLVKKGSYRYYYKNGKMVKKAWKTIKGARYYFQKNGRAAVGSCKISGKYYIFNATGKLAKGKKTRVVTIKKVKYQVTKAGRAKSGWNTAKTSYFKTNGAIVTNGTKKIGSKTYAFNPNGVLIKGDGVKKVSNYDCQFLCASSTGVYDAARTKLLNQYASYSKECSALISLLGTPVSKKVDPACITFDNQPADNVTYVYPKFKLQTFKIPSGKEYFSVLEMR